MCGIVGLFLKDKSLEPRLGEMLADMNDCNRSGDAEPACRFILDAYKPEFRIVRKVRGKYQNVIAFSEEKSQVCREIYGGSETNFNDEGNANLYLVWAAASDLEAMTQEAK